MKIPDQTIRDAYDAIGDLMPGIGNIAIDADRIARINDTLIAFEQAGVRNLPDRLKRRQRL